MGDLGRRAVRITFEFRDGHAGNVEIVDYQLTRIPEWQSPERHHWPDRHRTPGEVFKDELEARGLSAHALAIALRLRGRRSGQRAVTLLSVIYMSKTHKVDSVIIHAITE
jgi:hypothetical protein